METGGAAGQLVSLASGSAWSRGDVIVILLRMHHPYPFSFYPNPCCCFFSLLSTVLFLLCIYISQITTEWYSDQDLRCHSSILVYRYDGGCRDMT